MTTAKPISLEDYEEYNGHCPFCGFPLFTLKTDTEPILYCLSGDTHKYKISAQHFESIWDKFINAAGREPSKIDAKSLLNELRENSISSGDNNADPTGSI